ncbi:MAG: Uma2 family endonuclease [Spirulinaceae cyanobacterium]
MQLQTKPKTYTPEEYLELEAQGQERHEYRNGEIIAMTGGTANHNRISLNFASAFKVMMRRQGYQVFMADMKVWLPEPNIYTYPDVMIVEGEPVYERDTQVTILNPCVIVEVLSPSTQNYDRSEKFQAYRTIPEFREYLLIDPATYQVEQYVKKASDRWTLRLYDGLDATLTLESIPFELPFTELYEDVIVGK